jgi:sulfite reductase (NADPH) hemoprotein beta-component
MSDLDVEKIKAGSRQLRGSLSESLVDPRTGAIADSDTVISKFHGIYQQDDRDQRSERRAARLEPLFSFMLRVRVPGGRITRQQWLALDRLSEDYANGTIRLTTRQAVQFHGIWKESLQALVRGIDAVGMDSLAACGDVNRNVMCHVQPELGPVQAQTLYRAEQLSAHLTPQTAAWREIWIDGEPLRGDGSPSHETATETTEDEPVYGKTYLPRKFKIAIAVPPSNDVDVFTQDIGFIAVIDGDRLQGFNVAAGGGMGCGHGEPDTFPLLGRVIGFIEPEQMLAVAEAIVTTQRDFGDRDNRKHARFKYTLDDRSSDWLLDQIEQRSGIRLQPARSYSFSHSSDRFGWAQALDGRWQYTLFIENGRLMPQHRQALREIIARHADDFRITPNQNLVITGIDSEQRDQVLALLQSAGLDGSGHVSVIRRHSMACVALPTCGLAMAEAERYLPDLITRIEELAARHGLEDQPINIRMSGCPNGCSRPYLGEIGLVGRAPGRYNLYLGAAHNGERLNRLVLDNADETSILATIEGWLGDYASQRSSGESLGDFAVRHGLVAAVEHGSEVNAT